MEVNDELVDKVAKLAKLGFEGEAKEAIKADLQRIIGFVEKLQAVDTEGVEPLVYMTDEDLRLRDDKSETTISKADALKNAPSADSDFFKVPKFSVKK